MNIPVILLVSILFISQGNAEAAEPTSGCRSPSETWLAPEGRSLPCTSCAAEIPDGCQINSWQGFYGDDGQDIVPWYNVIKWDYNATCDFESTPPCASCSLRDEEELLGLEAPDDDCNEDKCESMTAMDLLDPCFSPTSCGCFCEKAMHLTEKCTHLPAPYP